jgi:hypothetical protein
MFTAITQRSRGDLDMALHRTRRYAYAALHENTASLF